MLITQDLAKTIAAKGAAVPLVMMEAFVNDRNGYKPEHYQDAEHAVQLFQENGADTEWLDGHSN